MKKSTQKLLRYIISLLRIEYFFNLPKETKTLEEYFDKYFSTYQKPYLQIFDAVKLTFELPQINEKYIWPYNLISVLNLKKIGISKFENGFVQGANGAIFSKEFILISDLSRAFGYRNLHPLLIRPQRLQIETNIGVGYVAASEGSATYYHWLFDILPRLLLLKKSKIFKVVDYFILPEIKTKFQRESLLLAEFNQNQIFELTSNNKLCRFEVLLVPDLFSDLGYVDPRAISLLREEFLPKIKKNTYFEKIYISRRKSNSRSLLNEPEIITFLQDFGFKSAFPEELSFLEQVELFNNAQIIIAPHGSGLSNIVFCNKETIVIELMSSDFVVPCYYSIGGFLDIKFYPLFNSIPSSPVFKPHWEQIPSDFHFSLRILEEKLMELKIALL